MREEENMEFFSPKKNIAIQHVLFGFRTGTECHNASMDSVRVPQSAISASMLGSDVEFCKKTDLNKSTFHELILMLFPIYKFFTVLACFSSNKLKWWCQIGNVCISVCKKIQVKSENYLLLVSTQSLPFEAKSL